MSRSARTVTAAALALMVVGALAGGPGASAQTSSVTPSPSRPHLLVSDGVTDFS
jgi:hypothetical protein